MNSTSLWIGRQATPDVLSLFNSAMRCSSFSRRWRVPLFISDSNWSRPSSIPLSFCFVAVTAAACVDGGAADAMFL